MKMFVSLLTRFFHETPGDAGAGGSSGGTGDSGAGAGGAGGGAPQFTKFDPNASYDFGDGKPIKGSDYMARHMPVEQYNKGRDFLLKEAERLEKLYGRLIPNQQRPPQQTQPQQRTNPMERFANAPVIDGRMLNDAYQAMAEGDIKPMTQALTQIAGVVKAQQAEIANLKKGYGTITEQGRTQDYTRTLTGGIESLGFAPEIVKAHPFLKEFAEDVYLSHDTNDPNLPKEFPGLLKSRIDAAIKLVRALDKAQAETQRTMKRTFTRPGGNAQPGQPSRYQHENGATLARRLFHSDASQQT